jgi:lipopolysaccharide/colanic/teichoic acid biosynthesis glycosyltransferase
VISILIMAEGSRATLLSAIKAMVPQIQKQAASAGQEIEILILDRAGALVKEDVGELGPVDLVSCPGQRPAAARNLGLKQAKGCLLCFVDSDCLPVDGWLQALIAPLDDRQVVGVKGSYTCAGNNYVRRFIQLEHETRYRRLEELPAIDFVDMYSAAYRRAILLANDGFNERFGRLEEQELAYRLAGRGYKMVFRREAQVQRQHPSSLAAYARSKAIIGYWKAQVIRLFPDRGLSDSYTPQTLKLQIGSLFGAGLMLLLSIFHPWFLLAFAAGLLLFLASTLPLLAMIWVEDRPLLVVAAPMLVARALSLGAGYVWGILRPEPGLAQEASTISGMAYLVKRLVDIVGALVGLLITILLAPFLSPLIAIDSPGPVLFRQSRIGRGGRPFVLYKFRTMDVDAEERLAELVDLGHLAQPAFKLANDPRVTRVGRFLRRWSLDELPQFWNVLRGEMSLVGPRPEEARIVALYSDWHRRRLAVKPGMTGPMQIHGRGDLPLDQRLKLEIEYIEEYTLWRDMKILARTIPSLLTGKGAR